MSELLTEAGTNSFYAGVCPSTLRTTLVVLPADSDVPTTVYPVRAPALPPDLRRFGVYEAVARAVAQQLAAEPSPPALVAVQGYTVRGEDLRHITQTELGALVRDRIVERGYRLLEVPPCTVIKFIAGRGDADLPALRAVLKEMYGRECSSDEEAIAYSLAHVARCALEPAHYRPWRVRTLHRLNLQG